MDHVARFATFAGAHELSAGERDRLESMEAKAESGHPGFADLWADGYAEMNRRSHTWLEKRRSELAG